MSNTNLLEVTQWDKDGNTTVHEFVEPMRATQSEIDEIVMMIEGGCPAHIAAAVVINSPQGELK